MVLVSRECMLITGAAGFTGRHACIHFLEKGMRVVALVHQACPEFAADIEVIVCDLLDANAVAAVIQQVKPDYVLHLAGANSVPASWRQPLQSLHVNVLGTLHVLDALRDAACAVIGYHFQAESSEGQHPITVPSLCF